MIFAESKTLRMSIMMKAFTVFALIHVIVIVKWHSGRQPIVNEQTDISERAEPVIRETLNIVKPRQTVRRKAVKRGAMPFTFNKERPLAFIHIGKSGGTSMDAIFKHAAKVSKFHYVGHKHFDYEYVHRHFHGTAQVIMLHELSMF